MSIWSFFDISVPETETSMTSMGWQAKDTGNKLFQEGAVGYVLQVYTRDLKKPPEGCDMWLPRQACRKWQAFSERVSGVWRGIFKEFFQCNAHIEVNASRSSGIQAIDWQIDSVSPSAESDWLTAWLLDWMISGYCSSSSERRAPLLALDLLGSWLLPSNMAMAQVVFQGHLASGRIWQSHGESTQGVRVIGASWRPKLAQWKCVNQMVSLLNQIWDFCIRVQGSILICAGSFGNVGNSLLVHLEHDESVSKWRDTLKSIVSYQQLAFPADLGDPKILRHPNHWLNIEAPDTLRGVLHSNRAWSSEKLWLWQFDVRNLKTFVYRNHYRKHTGKYITHKHKEISIMKCIESPCFFYTLFFVTGTSLNLFRPISEAFARLKLEQWSSAETDCSKAHTASSKCYRLNHRYDVCSTRIWRVLATWPKKYLLAWWPVSHRLRDACCEYADSMSKHFTRQQ